MDVLTWIRRNALSRQIARTAVWRMTLFCITALLVTILASQCSAQELVSPPRVSTQGVITQGPTTSSASKSNSVDEALSVSGSVTFRKTPLSEVIFTLSELWQVNIVAGSDIEGEVSGVFHNAPLREVLDSLLSVGGYSYRRHGSSIVVLPAAQIGSDDPGLVTRTVQFPAGSSDATLLEGARALLSPRGKLQPLDSIGMALLVDTPEAASRVEQFLLSLSSAGSTNIPQSPASTMNLNLGTGSTNSGSAPMVAYFTPQFIDAKSLQPALQNSLSASTIITTLETENRLMVMGEMEQLRIAEQIVRSLDIAKAQVRITALIYDVSLSEKEQHGFDWNHSIRSANVGASGLPNSAFTGSGGLIPSLSQAATTTATTTGGATAGAAGAATTAVANGTNLGFRAFSSSLELQTFIQALDETKGAKLLADPTISVIDRNEASIRIVTRIPYQQLTQTQQGGSIGTTAFEEAGIILTVTPRISRDGTIEMTVTPEFSVLAGYQNGQPIIDSRSAQTVVRIGDRQTFALGGLRQTSTVETIRGVPYLKDIKYLGKLFSAHNSELVESELIVFMRPEIINPYWLGTPREQAARCVASAQLDRVIGAVDAPLTPDCKDPYCPIHHPRPRPMIDPCCPPCTDMLGGQGMTLVEVEEGLMPVEGGPILPLPPHQTKIVDPSSSVPSYQSSNSHKDREANDIILK